MSLETGENYNEKLLPTRVTCGLHSRFPTTNTTCLELLSVRVVCCWTRSYKPSLCFFN